MTQYNEESLQFALKDVAEGVSQRLAAKRWGVPRATLYRRLNGATTRREVAETQQRLSKDQEKRLVSWILVQDSIGLPPSHQQIVMIATRLLIQTNDLKPLGRYWIDGFIRCNPEIKVLRGKRIDFQRFNGVTTDRIKAFFHLYNNPAIKIIPLRYCYNMDESGIMEGQGDNGLVLGSSRKCFAL
jgi:hypothetical protein